jgi:dephospho-CoA kinase
MKIFGVAGTNGSGKDTVSKMLAERHGFLFADASAMFVAELNKRGLPIDREHKAALSAEWRRESGMGVIVDKAVEMFNAEPGKYKGLVVGSLRHPGEADRVHELGGTVVWVDADPRVRYDRIQKNLHERITTHAEAGKTFEEFLAEQEREMTPVGDEATLNISAVKDRADITLINDGNDMDAFKDEAEKALVL